MKRFAKPIRRLPPWVTEYRGMAAMRLAANAGRGHWPISVFSEPTLGAPCSLIKAWISGGKSMGFGVVVARFGRLARNRLNVKPWRLGSKDEMANYRCYFLGTPTMFLGAPRSIDGAADFEATSDEMARTQAEALYHSQRSKPRGFELWEASRLVHRHPADPPIEMPPPGRRRSER